MAEHRAVWLSVVVETNDDGFLASMPDIPGAFAEGNTIEEALFNCVDVVKLIADYRRERGEVFPAQGIDLNDQTRLALTLPVGIAL